LQKKHVFTIAVPASSFISCGNSSSSYSSLESSNQTTTASPSISPSAPLPEYVGTWKGTNITAGSNIEDVTAILTSTTYEFDLYLTGTTAQTDVSRGTHTDLPPIQIVCCPDRQLQRQDRVMDGFHGIKNDEVFVIRFSHDFQLFVYDPATTRAFTGNLKKQ
jgi:hypothetical protein